MKTQQFACENCGECRQKILEGDFQRIMESLAWTTIPFHEDWTSSDDDSDASEDTHWHKPSHYVAFALGLKRKADPGIDLEWDPKRGMKASALIGPRHHFHSWLSVYSDSYFGGRTLHPIKCPEFPNIADYDICWMLFAIQQCQILTARSTCRELELYYQAIILLSGQAVR